MPFIGNKPSAVPLTSADIADGIITSAKIADGTIVNGDINASAGIVASKLSGTGKVLQVVSTTNNTNTTSSSSTFADTGLTLNITPSSASSKILVFAIHNGCGKSTNDTALRLKLLRGATDLVEFEKFAGATSTSAQNNFGSVAISFLDSPNTTSATTYKTQLASFSNNATVYVNTGTIFSSITLMEIAG